MPASARTAAGSSLPVTLESRACGTPRQAKLSLQCCNTRVAVWDRTNGQKIVKPFENPVAYAAFSPDSQWVLTCGRDHTARILDVQTGSTRTSRMEHKRQVLHGGFSPDSRLVVTASDDGFMRVWDAWLGELAGVPVEQPAAV